MATQIRSDISRKNKHWIPKERYLELKHFCLQFPSWMQELQSCNAYLASCEHLSTNDTNIGRHTEEVAERILDIRKKTGMVMKCAKEADPALEKYLLTAVINGKTYTNLKTMYDIPCCREFYYEAYRKFFWLLDKERG